MYNFQYTEHIIMWSLLSTQANELIKEHERCENLHTAIINIKYKVLRSMGYKNCNMPYTHCFACEYNDQFDGEGCSCCPIDIGYCIEDENSMYSKLGKAIERKDHDMIREICLGIARAKMKENVKWK